MDDHYINIIEGMTDPPCENRLIPCFVNKKLEELQKLDEESDGHAFNIRIQAEKEKLKSYYCDACYDYFYDKLRDETLEDE